MQQQQVRAQQSVTSLAQWAPPRTNGVDPFNGSDSREFCNSFWGPGDSGPNVLFARMRGAARTTDELRNFWHERTNIEEEYAQKLAKLSKVPVGADEVGELRTSLNVLRKETEAQAASHLELAHRMRNLLEQPTAEFHMKQVNHRRTLQANMEKKLKTRQTQETYAARAKEKCEGDWQRITAYTQQLTYITGRDAERLETKLRRTKETAQANEKDFAAFTQALAELLTEWKSEWKTFCDSCHDMEEDRMEFMKDNLWLYANEVSTLCVSDDQSCERIREALDQFEPERDVLTFAEEYGSGNELPQPPTAAVDATEAQNTPKAEFASYQRKTLRVPREYPADIPPMEVRPAGGSSPPQPKGNHVTAPGPVSPTTTSQISSSQVSSSHPPTSQVPPSPTPRRTPSMIRQPPLPIPNGDQALESAATGSTRRVLFYVKALYDYTATIDEEFDFQQGDIIAVTAAPEDGWWSGELLDEARRVEGKHIFPSNFVCLF